MKIEVKMIFKLIEANIFAFETNISAKTIIKI